MNAKEARSWYRRISDIILEEKTFDVSTNTDGFRTVYQMISKKMCDDMTFAQMIESFPQYCHVVKQNLPHAICYLTDELNIPVYRLQEPRYEATTRTGSTIQKGGKFIEYLTIDVEYRDAKEAELERISSSMRRSLSASKRNLQIIAPRKDFEVLVSKELRQIIS
jgi:hypothetical protein